MALILLKKTLLFLSMFYQKSFFSYEKLVCPPPLPPLLYPSPRRAKISPPLALFLRGITTFETFFPTPLKKVGAHVCFSPSPSPSNRCVLYCSSHKMIEQAGGDRKRGPRKKKPDEKSTKVNSFLSLSFQKYPLSI